MVTTPKFPFLVVIVVFSISEVMSDIECYSCNDPSGKTCGGKAWDKKNDKNEKTTCKPEQGTMCVSVFDKEAKAILRGCLAPEMDVFFKSKICVEHVPDVKEFWTNGFTACACKKDNCNIGVSGASGIELKLGIMFGTPLFLLGIHFY